MILMESAAKIRRLVLRDGRSIRSVSRSTGLSRNTIKKYLNDATPPRYQRNQPPVRHKLQGFEERLRSLFEQDQNRARRERRTAVKLYEQLVEDGYTGSYSPVCRFVKTLKAAGSELLHAYIPLHFKPGFPPVSTMTLRRVERRARTNSAAPCDVALTNNAQMSASRSQTVTTRVAGQARAS